MNEKQVQESLVRIDGALSQLNINRQSHIMIANDLKLVQDCCTASFKLEQDLIAVEEKLEKTKQEFTDYMETVNVRTDKSTDSITTCNQNS